MRRMGFFNRGERRRTALEAATANFGSSYGAYSRSEREVIVSLLKDVYNGTKHPAFGKLATDFAGLVLKIGPLLTSGKAMPAVLLAIDQHAPVLAADLALAIGIERWQAGILDAAQALR